LAVAARELRSRFPLPGCFAERRRALALRCAQSPLQDMKVRDVIKLLVDDGWYLVASGAAISNTSTRQSQAA
jgi:hypothetical protein